MDEIILLRVEGDIFCFFMQSGIDKIRAILYNLN